MDLESGSREHRSGSARLAGRGLLAAQSDERLVNLARWGSEPAFEAIVERYYGPLARYCRSMVAPARVDDILQHTFLSAYRRLRSDGRELTLKPWLFRVTHNAALDALRRDSRGYEQLDESYDGVERPDQALDRKESIRALVVSLAGLPERQRSALLLRELEGRSYEEILHELGVTRGALRQLLHRARTNLRTAASAFAPSGLFLRPELPLGGAVGAGAAKAGAVIATTAVIGAAALSTGHGKPEADAAEKSGGGRSAVIGAPSASETTEERDPWATASERRGARIDAGGRRTPRRSAARRHNGVQAGPKVRQGTGSPGLAVGEEPGAGDDSAGNDDPLGQGDTSGGDNLAGGDGWPARDDGPGGADDDSAPSVPAMGDVGADDDAGDDSAPVTPQALGGSTGEEADDDD
jgi:RNA polymerase sigma factor (sigma-70 family)